jgi:beta-catenin-like protein 1
MRLILREQKKARTSALKVLSYTMNNLEGKESCQAFVEMLGLGVLFPLFMKPVKISKKKKGNSYNNEEHIVSIIASLLKNCIGNSKQRVLLKFTENDYEKVDR